MNKSTLFQSDVTDVVAKPRPGTPPGRVAMWAMMLGMGGFLLWAALAPLDEGVPGQGMVTIDTKSKAVQHLTGGIIKEVLVKEGQEVQQGQSLIRLDEANAKAQFETARQHHLGLRAMEGRLQAERLNQDQVVWHPELQEAMSDPQIRLMAQTQQQLHRTRRTGLRAELQSIEESIQGQLGMQQSYAAMLSSRRTQLGLLQEELNNTSELVKEGYVPRNRQLELERMTSELHATIAELTGNTSRGQRLVNELRQRALARQQDYRKEVETQLSEVEREVQAASEKQRALQADLNRIDIKAPVTGQVFGLAFQSVGGVVGAGQKLMDIVPQTQSLLLEARVPPNLIDRVRAGQPVDVRFSTFANAPQLVVEGKVSSVSGDLLIDNHTGAGYYLALVAVTPQGMKQLGQRKMQAGMPVEVVFLTGERSLLTYVLHPLVRRMAASMKEE